MNKDQALSKAMQLCSGREYASSEIRNKLNDWDVPLSEIEWVIEQLYSDKFIDDFRMARYYSNDKLRFNKWGRIKIKIMLQQKGVDNEAITAALNQLDLDEYLRILKEELIKKKSTIKDKDEYYVKAKLFRFAAGRGFEADIIYRIMDGLI
jgi:regulatory protein